MPIYAYRCASCGHARDVLQKMSDAVLVTCPVCNADSFQKQLTAAGFQLKGSGWYATDFRNGQTAAAKSDADAGKSGDVDAGQGKGKGSDATAPAAGAAAKPDAAAPPAAATPAVSGAAPAAAGGSGTSCAP